MRSDSLRTARGGRTSGFTLIEILIAIAIFALLMTAVWMSLDSAVQTRNAIANTATPYTVGPAILDRLAEDLANVYFYDFAENNTFYGSDADLLARPADAISFIAMTKSFAPDYDNYQSFENDRPKLAFMDYWQGENTGRWSYTNEVAYLCRVADNGFLELWRREDWFVDDYPHKDGEYVLLYPKVHSLSIQYVSRNASTAEGVGASRAKKPEEMIQDAWNPVDERGLPRAVLVELKIYAQDSIASVEEQIEAGQEPKIYTFRRYITLPQVHMSLGVQNAIADWNGAMQAPVINVANAGGRGGAGGPGGGPGAGGPGGGPGGGNPPPGNRPTPPRTGQPNAPIGNPFLDALRGQGGRPSGTANPNLGGLFGGGRR